MVGEKEDFQGELMLWCVHLQTVNLVPLGKHCQFDSDLTHHLFRSVAQFGRASGLGPEGRQFESGYSDHFQET